jgi:hypothetical protein
MYNENEYTKMLTQRKLKTNAETNKTKLLAQNNQSTKQKHLRHHQNTKQKQQKLDYAA